MIRREDHRRQAACTVGGAAADVQHDVALNHLKPFLDASLDLAQLPAR
ncbi:MAG: hypothetical protein ACRDTH_02360 [Pseudonocardiaceae bacterium]